VAKKKQKRKVAKRDEKSRTTLMIIPLDLKGEIKALISEHQREKNEKRTPLDRKAYALDNAAVAEITKHIKIVQKLSGKLEKQGNKLNDIDRELSSKDADWVEGQLDKLGAIQEQIENAQIEV
jgi:hypothetical protein